MYGMTKELADHYPSSEWNVFVETKAEEIAKLLAARDVTAWGQGEIEGTEFYQLITTSPQHKGDKRLAIVARTQDVRRTHVRND